MVNSTRHKCFISYHKDDKYEVEEFIRKFDHNSDIFITRCVGVMDIDIIDSQDSNYIMRRIREKYLTDSTVTIVMIGKCTWARKFVDWEIASTLRDDPKNKRSGLLGIRLPNCGTAQIPPRLSDNIDSGYANCYNYPKDAGSLGVMIETAYLDRTSKSACANNSRQLFGYNRSC